MSALFLKVFNMAMTAGYCVLAVLLLRLFLRRFPKIYSYVLWSVVCFRLVCPVSFHSPFSLVRIDPQVISRDLIAGEEKRDAAAELFGYSAALKKGAALPYGVTAEESAALQKDGVKTQEDAKLRPDTAPGRNPVTVTFGTGGKEAGGSPAVLLLSAAGWIWITVAQLLLFCHFWQLLRLKRQLAGAKAVGEHIYEAEDLQTPFAAGIFAPRIYLPASLFGRERRYVLAHERTHIRRRDYLVKQTAFALACVYWFHPLIWLAFYLMCRDMEMSCDECVIREMGAEVKREYSASLLSLASGRQILAGSPLAFGAGGVRARIINVLSYRRPGRKAGVLLAVLLAAILAGLSLNPAVKADERSAMTPVDLVIRSAADMTMAPDLEMPALEPAEKHRPGFKEPVLHLYVPESTMETGYVDLTGMPQEEYEVYAVQALRELYDLTGTQIEECCYFYYDTGSYVFALTKDDMDHGREFYMRSYSERVDEKFWGIESIYLTYAGNVWYSPVYQYELPADFDTYDDEEKAVWFLTNSGAYNGRQIQQCFRPYDDMPETWRIIMDDDTAYELTLDTKINAVTNLTGPYPDSDIRH